MSAMATSALATNKDPETRGRAMICGMADIRPGLDRPESTSRQRRTAIAAVPCRSLARKLLANRVKRAQFVAAHHDHLRPQPAMAVDPCADFRRIEPHDQRTALAGRHQRT